MDISSTSRAGKTNYGKVTNDSTVGKARQKSYDARQGTQQHSLYPRWGAVRNHRYTGLQGGIMSTISKRTCKYCGAPMRAFANENALYVNDVCNGECNGRYHKGLNVDKRGKWYTAQEWYDFINDNVGIFANRSNRGK